MKPGVYPPSPSISRKLRGCFQSEKITEMCDSLYACDQATHSPNSPMPLCLVCVCVLPARGLIPFRLQKHSATPTFTYRNHHHHHHHHTTPKIIINNNNEGHMYFNLHHPQRYPPTESKIA